MQSYSVMEDEVWRERGKNLMSSRTPCAAGTFLAIYAGARRAPVILLVRPILTEKNPCAIRLPNHAG